MTPERVLMIRDVALRRQEARFRRDGRLLELATRNIAVSVHAAAGNKQGIKPAGEIRFFPESEQQEEKRLPSTEGLMGMMGAPLIPMDEG